MPAFALPALPALPSLPSLPSVSSLHSLQTLSAFLDPSPPVFYPASAAASASRSPARSDRAGPMPSTQTRERRGSSSSLPPLPLLTERGREPFHPLDEQHGWMQRAALGRRNSASRPSTPAHATGHVHVHGGGSGDADCDAPRLPTYSTETSAGTPPRAGSFAAARGERGAGQGHGRGGSSGLSVPSPTRRPAHRRSHSALPGVTCRERDDVEREVGFGGGGGPSRRAAQPLGRLVEFSLGRSPLSHSSSALSLPTLAEGEGDGDALPVCAHALAERAISPALHVPGPSGGGGGGGDRGAFRTRHGCLSVAIPRQHASPSRTVLRRAETAPASPSSTAFAASESGCVSGSGSGLGSGSQSSLHCSTPGTTPLSIMSLELRLEEAHEHGSSVPLPQGAEHGSGPGMVSVPKRPLPSPRAWSAGDVRPPSGSGGNGGGGWEARGKGAADRASVSDVAVLATWSFPTAGSISSPGEGQSTASLCGITASGFDSGASGVEGTASCLRERLARLHSLDTSEAALYPPRELTNTYLTNVSPARRPAHLTHRHTHSTPTILLPASASSCSLARASLHRAGSLDHGHGHDAPPPRFSAQLRPHLRTASAVSASSHSRHPAPAMGTGQMLPPPLPPTFPIPVGAGSRRRQTSRLRDPAPLSGMDRDRDGIGFGVGASSLSLSRSNSSDRDRARSHARGMRASASTQSMTSLLGVASASASPGGSVASLPVLDRANEGRASASASEQEGLYRTRSAVEPCGPSVSRGQWQWRGQGHGQEMGDGDGAEQGKGNEKGATRWWRRRNSESGAGPTLTHTRDGQVGAGAESGRLTGPGKAKGGALRLQVEVVEPERESCAVDDQRWGVEGSGRETWAWEGRGKEAEAKEVRARQRQESPESETFVDYDDI